MKNLRTKKIYIAVFLALALIPLITMPVFGMQDSEDGDITNIEDIDIKKDGKINKDFLRDVGVFFSYKFGFRQEMVDTNAHIMTGLFGTSPTDNVIIGKDGFLFYGDTLKDFMGRDTMSDYEINSAAYNLKLLQSSINADGSDFIFTVAPNANTLYPEYMSGKYRPDVEDRNSVKLADALSDAAVRYTDLFAVFESEEEVLYHKEDQHWNNRGAALAASAILDDLKRRHTDYSAVTYTEQEGAREDISQAPIGDNFSNLYPTSVCHEKEIIFDMVFGYQYWNTFKDEPAEIKNTAAGLIDTRNEERDGSVFVHRDSFGNALLPFIAEEYGKATFVWSSPHDFRGVASADPDAVIYELVERNIFDLYKNPPLAYPGEKTDLPEIEGEEPAQKIDHVAKMTTAEDDVNLDGVLEIRGKIDKQVADEADLYVSLENMDTGTKYCYPVYRVAYIYDEEGEPIDDVKPGADPGFGVYLDGYSIEEGRYLISLIAEEGKKEGRTYAYKVCEYDHRP